MDLQQPWTDPAWILQSDRMLNSFHKLLGYSLFDAAIATEESGSRAKRLFECDAVVLAHGAQEEPIFCYGNREALRLWEIDLPTLLTMPSRQSAEIVERDERSQMLKRGLEKGFIDDYDGIRISSTGKRFHVRNAIIWNVFDEHDQRIGQAATFREWEFIEK